MAANDAVFIGASTDATSIQGAGVDVSNPQEGDVLTFVGGEWVNQDRGGVNFLHQATVLLTDAQIKALPTANRIVVPATETLNYTGNPTQLLLPVMVTASLSSVGAYTNIDASALVAIYWGDQDVPITSVLGSNLNTAQFRSIVWPFLGGPVSEGFGINLTDSLFDNSIRISASNAAAGNYTGGDPLNTLTVSVAYYVLNTTTGEFV